jgi:hypothetical protein
VRAVLPGEVDDAELVVSELVTNAVVHAAPPVRVRLLQRGTGWVDVLVHDGGHACEQTPSGRPDHGRGLRIVAAVSESGGAWLDPQGCCRWARVALSRQSDAAAPACR